MVQQIVVDLPEWDRETDVVVIGFGGAGAIGAITAHDLGADVLIVEKQPQDTRGPDGHVEDVRHTPNSRMSAALIYCPSDVDAAYAYQKSLNKLYGIDDVPDEMVRVWAERVVENYDWLSALDGGEIFAIEAATNEVTTGKVGGPEFSDLPGALASRRIYNPQAGWGWFGCLSDNVHRRGIEVLHDCPAHDLIQHPATKEILGVRVGPNDAPINIKTRRAVVMACGGFEFDEELKASYLRVWPFRFYGNPANTGDGVRMAQKAGAALWHMNNVVGRATAWWPEAPHAFTIYPWARSFAGGGTYRDGTTMPQFGPSYSFIFVDRRGHRFAKEIYKPHIFYWQLMAFDPDSGEFPRIPFHMVFDDRMRSEGPLGGCTGATGPIKLYEWSHDNRVEIEKGWIRKAHSVAELAEAIAVPADNLAASIERWNRQCAKGWDGDFRRPPESLVAIEGPPYYELIQWPGGPNTLGGARRDARARIVDPDGQPIQRLYGAGEFGSMFGFIYEGGSNTAECIVFGRIAGENAARESRWDGSGRPG